MEHRRAKRLPANIQVLLYQRGLPEAVAVVRNISKSGMFVATDFDDIDINQKVDVEFRLEEGLEENSSDRDQRQSVGAQVVRKSAFGLALECDDDSDNFCSAAVAEVFHWLQLTSQRRAEGTVAACL